MSEKTIVITETDGEYQIENNGMSEFALIGVLECILFDLKTARRHPAASMVENEEIVGEQKEAVQESNREEPVKESSAPELRTRIKNAVKAVRALGGDAEETDLSKLTGEQLQAELEELTGQYKRLKNSKEANKRGEQ